MNQQRQTYRLVTSLLGLPRFAKQTIATITDVTACILATYFAFYLRLDNFDFISEEYWRPTLASLISVTCMIPVIYFIGGYKTMFRYWNWSSVGVLATPVLTYYFLYFSIVTVFSINGIPRTIGIIQPLVALVLIISIRLLFAQFLLLKSQSGSSQPEGTRTLIYGAGIAGQQLCNSLRSAKQFHVCGYVDDDIGLQGQNLFGIPILPPTNLEKSITKMGITHVLLAIPSASRSRRNTIIDELSRLQITVRSIPKIEDIVCGKVEISDILDLDVEDLLGRESVPPDPKLLQKNITNKVVMITGAGGTIGGELAFQAAHLKPTSLILVDHNEFGLYQCIANIEKLLSPMSGTKPRLVPQLASISDHNLATQLVEFWTPDTIFHAAAYKHVSMVEQNTIAGIANNVMGTYYLCSAAFRSKVSNFVLISTDKAVNPSNIMGASKRAAEQIMQAFAHRADEATTCRFSAVRFGNVLASSGSVIPKFRDQIRSGGPLTITDPRVTRYFMTPKEAAQLVIQSAAMAEGGEIFILDMGEPIKIIDIAKKMIRLSGLTPKTKENPEGDIEIIKIGLHPGEKLFEELALSGSTKQTKHLKILVAMEPYLPWTELETQIKDLKTAIDHLDIDTAIAVLANCVDGLKESHIVNDLKYLHQKGQEQIGQAGH